MTTPASARDALGGKGDARRGQDPDQIRLTSHGGDAGLKRAFQHVPGNSGVLPDNYDGNQVAFLLKKVRHGLSDAEGDLRAHGIPVASPRIPSVPNNTPIFFSFALIQYHFLNRFMDGAAH